MADPDASDGGETTPDSNPVDAEPSQGADAHLDCVTTPGACDITRRGRTTTIGLFKTGDITGHWVDKSESEILDEDDERALVRHYSVASARAWAGAHGSSRGTQPAPEQPETEQPETEQPAPEQPAPEQPSSLSSLASVQIDPNLVTLKGVIDRLLGMIVRESESSVRTAETAADVAQDAARRERVRHETLTDAVRIVEAFDVMGGASVSDEALRDLTRRGPE